MVVIVEGLDGIGKSTLCDQFKGEYEVIHEGYPGETPGVRIERMIRLASNIKSDKTVIYDRCTCIDDFIYCELNKNTSELTNMLPIVQNLLNDCKIVHMTLDKQTHLERFKKRGDEYITESRFEHLDRYYREFYNQLDFVYSLQSNGDLKADINQLRRIIND